MATTNSSVSPSIAKRASDVPVAADTALRIAAGLAARASAGGLAPIPPGAPRRVEPEALPLLRGAPEGRAFLALEGPRALALGAPAEVCPARAAAGGATPRLAAEGALRACLATLEAAGGAGADCGCRVAVTGQVALGPHSDFAYAPGVSARLVSAAAGLDLALVAREEAAPDGARRLAFHPAPAAAPAEALLRADGTVELRLGADVWRGARRAEGLVRGRYRERLDLTRADGARLTVAVGWEPVAYAVARDDLRAPPGG